MSEDSNQKSCCDDTTELAARLHAVADVNRLEILMFIGRSESGEVCACDFVAPIGKSQPTISHHLKILTEAGLIAGEKRGRWIWYRLVDDGISGLARRLHDLADPAIAAW